jgi:hypothetical protein
MRSGNRRPRICQILSNLSLKRFCGREDSALAQELHGYHTESSPIEITLKVKEMQLNYRMFDSIPSQGRRIADIDDSRPFGALS